MAKHLWAGRWYDPACTPLYVFMGVACGWAGFMGYRAVRGPDVVWTRENPEPWNTIKNEQTKLFSINQKLDGKWSR